MDITLTPIEMPEKTVSVDESQVEALILAARSAALNVYSPLKEKFSVGAALIMADDPQERIYASVNVENSVFNAGVCAERGVINYVVGQGFRTIKMIAVSTDHRNSDDLTLKSPCGLCRQAILEFSDKKTLIIVDGGTEGGAHHYFDIERLLPYGYRYNSIK